MFAYKGSTAMITGASKGLGAAFTKELAGRGMNLVLVARSFGPLQDLADSLGAQHGVRCVALQADLAVSDAVERIVTELERLDLKIDLLINNAGLGLTGDFLSHDCAAELASIQVNVQALVGLSHALGAKMVSRGTGGIINLASNAAFQPLPHMATYAAAKAFVLHFSEALEIELKGRGVQVMAVLPRADRNEFFRRRTNQDEERRVRQRRGGGWPVQRARRHLVSSSAAPQHCDQRCRVGDGQDGSGLVRTGRIASMMRS